MTSRTTRIAALSVTGIAAVAVLAACSDDGGSMAGHNMSAMSTSTGAASGSAASHNAADATFARDMIIHHTQAVEMSDTLLSKQGVPAAVTNLAREIKAAQGPEITTMQRWLTSWGMGSGSSSMPGMGSSSSSMPGMDHSSMPGMMSEADMKSLEQAQGVDAARSFLSLMIVHHEGAISMAKTELVNGQNADAKALAQNITNTQQSEITTMRSLLSSL
ncbi:MAG: DUF305 domain-containing protein [Gordonia polyisoprenivorans]|nr:DUF305 domain-containing protein [Gordonia polyisoprenivorans]